MRLRSVVFYGLASVAVIILLILAPAIVKVIEIESDPVGNCLSDGGYWNDPLNQCECTYADRGTYEENPTPEQISERNRCDAIVEQWVEDMATCSADDGEWNSKLKQCDRESSDATSEPG